MPKIYIEGELGCPEVAEAGQVLAGQGASVSTQAGNLLTTGTDGRVYLSCEAVQDCIGQAIAAGVGLRYEDARNALSSMAPLAITIGVGVPLSFPNSPTIYTDTTTGNVYYRDVSGAIVLLSSPMAVVQANYQSPQVTVDGPLPLTGAPPSVYPVQEETWTIVNPDAVRTLHVLLRTSGSMYLAMSAAGTNVNMVHQLFLDGVAVGLAFEQNEVANGFESAFSGGSGYAFALPPSVSASLHLQQEIQVYAGGVNRVVSYVEYSWQGVLAAG
jgi:hypothetical protein